MLGVRRQEKRVKKNEFIRPIREENYELGKFRHRGDPDLRNTFRLIS